jgi:hypothetical protein
MPFINDIATVPIDNKGKIKRRKSAIFLTIFSFFIKIFQKNQKINEPKKYIAKNMSSADIPSSPVLKKRGEDNTIE